MDRTHQRLARGYIAMYHDASKVRAFVNREFGMRYSQSDIDNMLAAPARKPTDSVPRRPSQADAQPIAMHKPLATTRSGVDPLAAALWRYGAKHGTMTLTPATCRELLRLVG